MHKINKIYCFNPSPKLRTSADRTVPECPFQPKAKVNMHHNATTAPVLPRIIPMICGTSIVAVWTIPDKDSTRPGRSMSKSQMKSVEW